MSQTLQPEHPIAKDAMKLAQEIDGLSTRHAASLIEKYGDRRAAEARDAELEARIDRYDEKDEVIKSELCTFEEGLAARLGRFAPPLHPVLGALSRRLFEGYGDDENEDDDEDDWGDYIDLAIKMALKIIETIESCGARIVPEEPSREMKEAGADRRQEPTGDVRGIYKAMIAAVPQYRRETDEEIGD